MLVSMASRKSNPFAVLEEEEEFQFPPSALQQTALDVGIGEFTTRLGAPSHNSAATAITQPATSSLLSWQSGAGIDLSAVADELQQSAGDAHLRPALWNFGDAFATTSFSDSVKVTEADIVADAAKKIADAEANQRKMEEHLAAVHAREKDDFKEKINKMDLSHSSRIRKLSGKERATQVNDRLNHKVMKRNEAKKRLNKAKHDY